MLRRLLTWLRVPRSETAQDVAEYALLIGLMAVALVLVIGALAGGVANTFNWVRNALYSAGGNQIPVS